MSMATAIIKPTRDADGDQCVAFPDVGWKGYAALLRLRGERSWPRMVYLDGTVWLISPSFPHERLKKRLGQFATEVAVGLRIAFVPAGSTTLRRRARKGGVEGDQTYYLANEALISGKDQDRPSTDPPRPGDGSGLQPRRRSGRRSLSPNTRPRGLDLRRGRVGDPGAPAKRRVLRRRRPVRPFHSSRRPRCMSGSTRKRSPNSEWVTALRLWVQRTLMPRVRRQREASAPARESISEQPAGRGAIATGLNGPENLKPWDDDHVDGEYSQPPAGTPRDADRDRGARPRVRPGLLRLHLRGLRLRRDFRDRRPGRIPESLFPLAVRYGVPAALQGLQVWAPEDLRDGHQQ